MNKQSKKLLSFLGTIVLHRFILEKNLTIKKRKKIHSALMALRTMYGNKEYYTSKHSHPWSRKGLSVRSFYKDINDETHISHIGSGI